MAVMAVSLDQWVEFCPARCNRVLGKVAAGEFEIDYKKISQAMLKDVVAAIGQKPNRV